MNEQTIREHAEAILAEPRLYEEADYGTAMRHAEAILEILKNAEYATGSTDQYWNSTEHRVIPDPEPRDASA